MTKKILIVFGILFSLVLYGCEEKATSSVANPTEDETSVNTSSLEILPRESKIPADAVKMTPQTDHHPPILHSDEYEEPVPMPYPINTKAAEDSPFITPDGNNFYVWSTPDPSIPPNEQLFDGVTAIYWSKKVGGVWQDPQRLILNDEVSLDGCLFVRGNEAWFCSARVGNMRELDIYTAELVNGEWTNWQNPGEPINGEYLVGELHITSDGNTMYFHSEPEDSLGGYDIYSIEKVNGKWQSPEPVPAVNTEGMEGWPFVSEDMSELWFTRIHLGTPAIFKSEFINDTWQEPEMIISQFAGEPSLDNDGNLYFCHHFFKDGVMIEADIYVAMKK